MSFLVAAKGRSMLECLATNLTFIFLYKFLFIRIAFASANTPQSISLSCCWQNMMLTMVDWPLISLICRRKSSERSPASNESKTSTSLLSGPWTTIQWSPDCRICTKWPSCMGNLPLPLPWRGSLSPCTLNCFLDPPTSEVGPIDSQPFDRSFVCSFVRSFVRGFSRKPFIGFLRFFAWN